MPDDDRRVRRTRRALAAALVELASVRPYESITIRDITDRADIGYATFFRHYSGKDELMLEVFQDVARGLEAMAGAHGSDFFQTEGRLIFTHVKENQPLYRSILDSHVFARKLRKLLSEHIRRQIVRHGRPRAKEAVLQEIAVNHMATALVSLIEWWLGHGLEPSIDQMGQIYDRLIIQATWQTLLPGHQFPV